MSSNIYANCTKWNRSSLYGFFQFCIGDQVFIIIDGRYDDTKLTCSESYRIGDNKQGEPIAECERRCGIHENCRFYFYTTTLKWCALYSSCDDTRITGLSGSTYKKQSRSGMILRFESTQNAFLLTI